MAAEIIAAYCSGVGRCDGIGSLFGRFAGGPLLELSVVRWAGSKKLASAKPSKYAGKLTIFYNSIDILWVSSFDWRRYGWCNGQRNRFIDLEITFIRYTLINQTTVGGFWWFRERNLIRQWHFIFRRQHQPIALNWFRISQTVSNVRDTAAILLLINKQFVDVRLRFSNDATNNCEINRNRKLVSF